MKKTFLLMVLVCSVFIVNAQTITIDSIGMHKDGDPGNFNVEPGDKILVNVNYSTTGTIDEINNTHISESSLGTCFFLGYSSEDPTSGNFPSNTATQTIEDFFSDEIGLVSFTFYVPDTTYESFQIAFGLVGAEGENIIYSSTHTSCYAFFSLTAKPLTTTNFNSYMQILEDDATDQPTLYTPDSPTVATYDNNSLKIDFQLSENPKTGTVKLYFSPNSDGTSPSTTLTLSSDLEDTDRHEIELDASDFSTSDSDIHAVSGSTSLTHLNTYYVAIGYQDGLENPEARSSWNKLIYDNVAIKPTSVSGSTGTGSNFNVNFTLGEDAKTDGIKIYVKNSSTLIVESTIEMSGTYLLGSNSISLDGTDLTNSTNVSDVSGSNTLDSGSEYKFSVEMTDLAGNVKISTDSAPFQYINQNINVTASLAEYNIGDPLGGYKGADVFQAIGIIELKTDSGTATLSGIKVDVGGTIDVSDASNLAIYESTLNTFSSATQVSSKVPFIGSGTYSFSVNRNFASDGKNYFVAIELNSDGLTSDDHITLTTKPDYITTSGMINSFTETEFADKYLYKALLVDFYDGFPSITPGSPNAPIFRLDLKTNTKTTTLSSLTFNINGTLSSDDVETLGFKLWESSTTSFSPKSAKAVSLGEANFDNQLTFSGLTSEIGTDEKYYFLTVSTKGTANTEATIGASIPADGITVSSNTTIDSSFPINGNEHTLPVELSSFTALVIENSNVKIEWTVETETGLSGYYIFRGNSNNLESAMQIPVLIPSINSSQTYTYSFVDREIENNDIYYYWLKTVELSNESEVFGPLQVTVGNPNNNNTPQVDLGTTLYENYPNPFNPSTNISFSLATPQRVNIKIYNVRGQLVKVLFDSFVSEVNTKHKLVWNGDDNNNNQVASGVYYSKMIAGKHVEFRKMLLMK